MEIYGIRRLQPMTGTFFGGTDRSQDRRDRRDRRVAHVILNRLQVAHVADVQKR